MEFSENAFFHATSHREISAYEDKLPFFGTFFMTEKHKLQLFQGLTHSGGGGLLSTGNDYIKFAECLTRGGVSEDGVR